MKVTVLITWYPCWSGQPQCGLLHSTKCTI